jgi:F420-non-reducing hydrogenase small subunit
VVDLAEDILGVVEKVDIVLWPVAMDFKYKDLEAMADKSIVATLLNGAIRSTEQEAMARLLRRKSRYLIAYGSCACTGGIPALANQFTREQILKFNYEDAPSVVNEAKTRPQLVFEENGRHPHLPELHQLVRSLDQVVEVDFYIPGCPPTPKLTLAAVAALLDGRLPPKGSVLAPDIALCEECPRRDSKPVNVAFTEFKRTHQKLIDPQLCMLARPPARAAGRSAFRAICRAPAALAAPTGSRTRGRRSCRRCAPTSSRRKRRASTRCWRASPIRSARSTGTALPEASCAGRRT